MQEVDPVLKQLELIYEMYDTKTRVHHKLNKDYVKLKNRLIEAERVINFYANYNNYIYPFDEHTSLTAIEEDSGDLASAFLNDTKNQPREVSDEACPICEELPTLVKTYTHDTLQKDVNEERILVENVKSYSCLHCGNSWMSSEDLANIVNIINKRQEDRERPRIYDLCLYGERSGCELCGEISSNYIDCPICNTEESEVTFTDNIEDFDPAIHVLECKKCNAQFLPVDTPSYSVNWYLVDKKD